MRGRGKRICSARRTVFLPILSLASESNEFVGSFSASDSAQSLLVSDLFSASLLYNSRVGRRCISIVLFLLLVSAVSFGQGSGKAKLSYQLIAVHVKGINHYKEDQIVRAAGLRLGQMVEETDFKTAIDKLGSTGLFNDVAYSYQYSTAGCNLDIQVAENDKLAPVVFDNLVWFSDEELFRLLRSRLPLFEDKLPLGGNLSD